MIQMKFKQIPILCALFFLTGNLMAPLGLADAVLATGQFLAENGADAAVSIGRGLGEMGSGVYNCHTKRQENQREEIAEASRIVNDVNAAPEEKRAAQEKLDDLAASRSLEQQVLNGTTNLFMNTVQTGVQNRQALGQMRAEAEIKAKKEREKAYIAASEAAKGARDRLNLILNSPGKIAAITLSVALAGYGTKLAYNEIERYLTKPNIIQETNILSVFDETAAIFNPPVPRLSRLHEIVAPPSTKQRLDDIIEDIGIIQANRGIMEFSHLLLYGPPGTGKTMFAREIALSSGMNYIIFSGTSLAKLPEAEALSEAANIINYAKTSTIPVLIFIDEADGLLGNRENPNTSEKTKNLTREFLSQFEGPSHPNIMLVFATNMPSSLDKAALDRVDASQYIYMGYPGPAERLTLLNNYIAKEIVDCGIEMEDNLETYFQSLVTRMDKDTNGRVIEQMTKSFKKAAMRNNAILTKTAVDNVFKITNEGLVNRRSKESFLTNK